MRGLIKFAFAAFCFLAIFGYTEALVVVVRRQLRDPDIYFTFGLGAIIYTIMWLAFYSKKERFWSIVEHEMTHALFALLSRKKIHSLSASRDGGRVEIEGENFMIALSPYFFPLLAIIVVILKPSILPQYQWILNGVMGFAFMSHLLHMTREFHPAQPDLRRTGMLFSLIVVVFFNLFFFGICLAALEGEWAKIVGFISDGFNRTLLFFNGLFYGFYERGIKGLF